MLKNLLATILISSSITPTNNKSFNLPKRYAESIETNPFNINIEQTDNKNATWSGNNYIDSTNYTYELGYKQNYKYYDNIFNIQMSSYQCATYKENTENNYTYIEINDKNWNPDENWKNYQYNPSFLIAIAITPYAIITDDQIDLNLYLNLEWIEGLETTFRVRTEIYSTISPNGQNLIDIRSPMLASNLAQKCIEIGQPTSQYNTTFRGSDDIELTSGNQQDFAQLSYSNVPLLKQNTNYLIIRGCITAVIEEENEETEPYWSSLHKNANNRIPLGQDYKYLPFILGLDGDVPIITLSGHYNLANTTTEVIDLPGLMFRILTMPFTFISVAFNLTLFAGTPYAINLSNLFLTIIAVLIFTFIIKLIIKR